MNREPVHIDPIVNIVSRMVERDDVRRTSLLIEVEKAEQEGHAIHANGFDWRRFWVAFATQNRGLMLLMPVSILLYLVILYQWIFG